MWQAVGIQAQWVAIAGMVANIVGISIVALEWRTAMYDGLSRLEIEQDLLAISVGGQSTRTHEISPAARRLIDRGDITEMAGDAAKFDQFIKSVLILDAASRLSRRRTIFTLGFLFILAGSLAQLVASWPS